MDSKKKLYKLSAEQKIFGVCAGFADYFDADVTLIRVLWILITLLSFGLGFFGYIACAFVMPDKNIY
ncbi:PspC domain-containing protein [Clostridium cibarium]|uniref:PspC domain-containing protein n=1 Tax=Clostridium cibarium TaxID=2762247 RepID=A0ABR8PXY0_9CLOT|nr:PspC domain-containing protein [Clostridium cibarium]MBD7913026.1 PspC domain-containing protein [Clostridium cibarium]